MSYRVKIILDFEEKPTAKDIINYINELGEDIDFEIENKSYVREAIEKGHDWW